MHLVNGAEDIMFTHPSNRNFVTAYGAILTGSLALADPDQTAENADNYMWFATAMYLSQYDWTSVIAGKRQANGVGRRSISTEADGWKHTHHFRKHSHHWGKHHQYTTELEKDDDDELL
ncbi:uncharacterized protein N7479_002765 [Penicillium vulpinum]|uniref:Uncharacterized protein n=1 Tax=Penicillium vulpinum TaxID=29845 RepID=A0A1V6RTH0_9EURO|nr:uncharacterized protein N7479_002765 [Penicillium vulpinum]KAJ5972847.1 hypothetical protein N7479_002765 [Penicillium vulpinum]OQE05071.1 hypothetical protein PENVUL_c027G06094 [Penicillium vulpinum]